MMDINTFRLFREVAATGNISKVANNCHISQPALSQQIQKLEEHMGCKLFVRGNRGVKLTKAGEIVEKHTEHMLKAYDNMLEDLTSIDKNYSTIWIDACPTVATYALPCTLYELKEIRPRYNCALSSHLSEEVIRNVLNDTADIGFIEYAPDDNDLVRYKMSSDRLTVVASPSFKSKNQLYCKDILAYPLIMLHPKFEIRKAINSFFQKKGYNLDEYRVLFNLDSIESVKSSVIRGHGIAFLPYISIKKELYTNQLNEIKIMDFDMNYDIYMIYKRKDLEDKNIKEFIQIVKKIGAKSFC